MHGYAGYGKKQQIISDKQEDKLKALEKSLEEKRKAWVKEAYLQEKQQALLKKALEKRRAAMYGDDEEEEEEDAGESEDNRRQKPEDINDLDPTKDE